jgi:hypothetical protein
MTTTNHTSSQAFAWAMGAKVPKHSDSKAFADMLRGRRPIPSRRRRQREAAEALEHARDVLGFARPISAQQVIENLKAEIGRRADPRSPARILADMRESVGTVSATRTLRECCEQDGLTTDGKAGLIKNVKVLGLDSQNRRRYTTEAVQAALPIYEGIKVNLNHPEGSPNANRDVKDRFGKLVNLHVVEGEGLRGDLRYNPHHPWAKAVQWWAENDPDCLGLSHNAVGQGHDENGVFVVEKIVNARSVDLVADPATAKGLFE